jgi:hypothetical protein
MTELECLQIQLAIVTVEIYREPIRNLPLNIAFSLLIKQRELINKINETTPRNN